MINIGIIGHTGRLGRVLVEILNRHPQVKIVYLENRKEGIRGNLSDAELIFLALPYGESVNYLPKLENKKIIDLSIDNRCNPEWIYGLPELNKSEIKNARKLANPGCYATSIILGMAPLKGKIKSIFVSSTSGNSGAGIEVQGNDNFLVYKEGTAHPQIQEIKNILGLDEVLFVPQRIDTAYKGIISSIFTKYDAGEGELVNLYKEFYKNHPFVRIKQANESIETKNVNNTNFCDIKILENGNTIIVISALDNLIKGGVGQAVQNMNIMCGYNEIEGFLVPEKPIEVEPR